MEKKQQYDRLTVFRYATRDEMGAAAAKDIAAAIKNVLRRKECCNIIFAAAPSQNEVLAALAADKTVDFTRVNAFHMDEYCGLPGDAPQSFGSFLKTAIFHQAPFRAVHYLRGSAPDPLAECRRYSLLLEQNPTDIVCLGIGENGHIAFNDPPVADFHDPLLVKRVPLDPVCRNQQVHDGCFSTLSQVPEYALTLTVPALFRGKELFCVVPAATKAQAVKLTLTGPIGESCPASILRRHPSARLYLDASSASLLPDATPSF